MPNGPNDLERELLELARRQREANNQRQTHPAQELPDLHPGMLLSAAALDEVHAAASAAGQPIGILASIGNHEDMVAFDFETSDPEFNGTVEDVGVYHQALDQAQVAAIHSRGRPNANRDVFPEELYRQEVMAEFSQPNPVFTDDDLEAVFMNNPEAREALGAGITPMVPDLSIPIVSTPIRTTRDRLNVGWDPAARIARHHDMAYRDGPDTSVVSARMPDGSWRSRPLPRPQQAPPQRHQGVSMGTTVARAPEPAQAEPAASRPSRYAVLSGSDPFDD